MIKLMNVDVYNMLTLIKIYIYNPYRRDRKNAQVMRIDSSNVQITFNEHVN